MTLHETKEPGSQLNHILHVHACLKHAGNRQHLEEGTPWDLIHVVSKLA